MSLRVFVMRHGETQWSASGRHSGRVDIALTDNGRSEARKLGQRIADFKFSHVLMSPLERARHTCELAGCGEQAKIEPDLIEWDNGSYEGLTSEEVKATHPGWNLFRDGCPEGESPQQMSVRVDRLIKTLHTFTGDVAIFTHGHLGRVLAARWLGLPVEVGERFMLSTASLSLLDFHRDQSELPVISLWNSHA